MVGHDEGRIRRIVITRAEPKVPGRTEGSSITRAESGGSTSRGQDLGEEENHDCNTPPKFEAVGRELDDVEVVEG